MRVTAQTMVLAVVLCSSASAQNPLTVHANDNRVAAGRLANGVLTLQLDVVRAMWHPDRDIDPGIEAVFFAERGRAPTMPGPLIRVPVGTEVRTTVRNLLPDSSVVVFGLAGDRGPADSVRLLPGEQRELSFRAVTPGTYLYHALFSITPRFFGNDQVLNGALVIDEGKSPGKDRVLVLHQLMDSLKFKSEPGTVEELLSINGKSWPHTERMTYDLGENIRWRIINASFHTHPMHLHGAYYQVLSRAARGVDTIYTPAQVRSVVTERMNSHTTMMMEWKPERAGNWLFHCHLTFHIMPHAPLGEVKASGVGDHSMLHGMGGLVLGTIIRGPVSEDVVERRKLRLVVQQYDSLPGRLGSSYSYAFDDARNQNRVGPVIVLSRNEPVAITVVNRAQSPTAVHWHGLEIESFFDGVMGFGGTAARVTPEIAAGDSFVVRMSPPRAGTFIYHTHADELAQQRGGLYGAFVVLPEGEAWDPARDIPVVMGNTNSNPGLLINGVRDQVIELKPGVTYRLRLINITLANPGLTAVLTSGEAVMRWNVIAKDGMDLPAHQAGERAARQEISIGETYDVLFTPSGPGEYILGYRGGNARVLASLTLRAR